MMERDKMGRYIGGKFEWVISGGLCAYIKNDYLLFIIDEADLEIAKRHKWSKTPSGYIMCNKTKLTLHRILMNAQSGEMIDHINGLKWDNRRSNLRWCNKSQNAYNSKLRGDNTSGFTGVRFRTDTKKWTAQIKHNYQKINLGCFETKQEAIDARILANEKYCGEFKERE